MTAIGSSFYPSMRKPVLGEHLDRHDTLSLQHIVRGVERVFKGKKSEVFTNVPAYLC